MKKWVITGGCGFIGTSLISRLLNDDDDIHIRVLDNLSVGTREDLGRVCSFSENGAADLNIDNTAGVLLVEGDICDAVLTGRVCKGVDCIVHLAANTGVGPSVEDPRSDMQANIFGTFNMLEGARAHKVGKFIFASSGAPAGVVEPPIHEELAPHPVSPYGASKLAGEGYCSAYYHTFGINTVALRFGNVYGPGSKHKSSIVAKFIRQALNGEECEIYGDGSQTRDFIYIDDLIEAIVRSSNFDGGGETFQIASGMEMTLNEMVRLLQKIYQEETGKEMKINYGSVRLGDVARNYADTSKARDVLGWQVNMDMPTGLRNSINDLRNAITS